jgi:hypothetical protein
MELPHRGYLVLELLRPLELSIGDSFQIEDIFERGRERGVGDDDIQASLIGAAANGWVIAVDDKLHLSDIGHTLLHPANDN